jgi:hypothetical protein
MKAKQQASLATKKANSDYLETFSPEWYDYNQLSLKHTRYARQHSLHPAIKERTAVSYLNMGTSRSTKSFYVDQLVRLYPDFATHWPMPD